MNQYEAGSQNVNIQCMPGDLMDCRMTLDS